MKIKIAQQNQEKINSKIQDVEGSAKARCLTYLDLCDLTKRAENRLKELKIPVKERKGAKAKNGLEKLPNSYKWISYGTQVLVERGSTDWFLTNVIRNKCKTQSYGGKEEDVFILTESQQIKAVTEIPELKPLVNLIQ